MLLRLAVVFIFVLVTARSLTDSGQNDRQCRTDDINLGNLPWPPDSRKHYQLLERVARSGLKRTSNPKRIVVVGAGMAGLVAAYTLKTAGHDVTILEARNRVGGRVETYRDENNGWTAELGAMRIPASHKLVNIYIVKFRLPVFKFINNDKETFCCFNGVVVKAEKAKKDPDLLLFGTKGKERGLSDDQLYRRAICTVLLDLKTNGWDFVVHKYGNLSFRDYLKERNLSTEAIRMIADFSEESSFLNMSFLGELTASPFLATGDDYRGIVGGNDKLPKAFVPVLKDRIFMNSWVNAIDQKGKDVVVYFHSNTTGSGNSSCDYVIVTVPLPIISRIQFSPDLTSAKQAALQHLAFFPAIKIYLYFNRRFWVQDNINGGHSVTDDLSRSIYYPSSNDSHVILAAYSMGGESLKWPNNDTKCIQMALQTLSKLHDRDIEEYLVNGVVKRWQEDEYTNGAFSVLTASENINNLNILTRPEGRVFLAGEHASLARSWIEGAVHSALQVTISITKAAGGEV